MNKKKLFLMGVVSVLFAPYLILQLNAALDSKETDVLNETKQEISVVLESELSEAKKSIESLFGEVDNEEQVSLIKKLPLPTYTTQKFELVGRLKGLSAKQIEEHQQLYQGYVNKRNEIAAHLEDVDRSKANNVTYSPFRGLKLAETYAMNGDILHRLYFQNMGAQGKNIGPKTKEIIIKNFGSVENFKKDLFATASSALGWAITAFTIDDGRVHNYLLDTHNQKVPVMVIPLLVLDVYEHAYMIDFGIKRVPYLDVFWENIDWDVVENRVSFVEKQEEQWNDYFNASIKNR